MLFIIDDCVGESIAVLGIVFSSIELTERSTGLLHLGRLARGGRDSSGGLASLGEFDAQLVRGNILLSTGAGVQFSLVVTDIENSSRVLHQVGHFLLLGVDVDIEGPRGRGLGSRCRLGSCRLGEDGGKREGTSDAALGILL